MGRLRGGGHDCVAQRADRDSARGLYGGADRRAGKEEGDAVLLRVTRVCSGAARDGGGLGARVGVRGRTRYVFLFWPLEAADMGGCCFFYTVVSLVGLAFLLS